MSLLTKEDKELIHKFIGLSTEEPQQVAIRLPQNVSQEPEWSSCLLLKVLANKTVIDSSFESTMISTWQVDPVTKVTPISKGAYMAQFQTREEMQRIWVGGPWSYRGDMVAMRQVAGHGDLVPDLIDTVEVWVQLYNIPVASLKEEGKIMLGQEVGKLVSPPVDGFVGGRRFVKMKVMIPINEPVKDRVKAVHPTLGEVVAHCHYEKLSRICCFCGLIGHVMAECSEHLRLARLMLDPTIRQRPGMESILKPKKGKWIIDLSAIPKPQPSSQVGPVKRSYQQLNESSPAIGWEGFGPTGAMGASGSDSVGEKMEFAHSFLSKKPKPTGQNASAMDI